MTQSLAIGAFLAALFYVLIPGPAFLALLGIGAGQGRRAGALFMGTPIVYAEPACAIASVSSSRGGWAAA